jgi:signal transduction histidine kinase
MIRALIADDDQQHLYMLQVLLSANGFRVETAANGAEALERAVQAPPDIMISDILMPVMDGYSLCRAWRKHERLKDVPFVFLTATYTDPKDEALALSLGADRFIIKPIEPERLLAALQEIRATFVAGRPTGVQPPVEEATFYREYNAALIRKLEDKMLQLEQANHDLARDFAERERAEAERQKLQAQLIQAQKMESVGRLAGGIAHDFNNMLGVILGCAEVALRQLAPTHPLHGYLQDIQTAAKRSADLTRQLLAFARRQPVSPKVLDLNQTMTGMLKMLQRLIGEEIELTWRPGAGLWPVEMDPSQVDQILANLCVNARDAVVGAGRIVIETDNATFDAVSCGQHEGLVAGEYVRLSVRDSGCGMNEETLSHLFEPFFTTKGPGKGTGLGLATVYGVVKQNEGYVYARSKPAQGTTFEIYFPRAAAGPVPGSAPVPPTSAICGEETVLLVEDEPQLLKMTRSLLESLGYRVLSAGTAGEAIRAAEVHEGEIHLLLTDLVLPEMSGRDLSRRLLERRAGVKTLFVSGYAADVIDAHGVLEKGVQFLAKPWSMEELAVKVREVLARTPTIPTPVRPCS